MPEIGPEHVGGAGALLAIGTFLLRWRRAGYAELVETCERQTRALDAMQGQITELHARITSGHNAIVAAEQRAAAAEIRAENAEAARLLHERVTAEEMAALRAEIAVLRQQIVDAGLTPRTRGR